MKTDFDSIFEKLARSKFRSSFKLKEKDKKYIKQKGWDVIEAHCRAFVAKKLKDPSKFVDGKQTPMRGHPVFIAQHATATCCRGCLQKWHRIENSHILTCEEEEWITNLLLAWLKRQA